MLHPSYTDLMKVVNKDVEEGETKVVNSRYSIVLATSKRARQIIDGDDPLVDARVGEKPLSVAIDELNNGKLKILAEGTQGEPTEELMNEDEAEILDAETQDVIADDAAEEEEASEETAEALPETAEE